MGKSIVLPSGSRIRCRFSGSAAGREAGVNRSLVVRVMVAGDHHDRHLRPRDCSEGEGEAFFGDAGRIEQVADYQQHVGVAVVGNIDDAAECGAHFVAQLDAALA